MGTTATKTRVRKTQKLDRFIARRIAEIKAMPHGREIAFPKARKLADLFTSIESYDKVGETGSAHVWKTDEVEYGLNTRREYKGRSVLSKFCSVRTDGDWESLSITASPELIEWLADNMLLMDRDSISFEIVDHRNGTGLLVAKNSIILGSRWLAIIDMGSVPTFGGDGE